MKIYDISIGIHDFNFSQGIGAPWWLPVGERPNLAFCPVYFWRVQFFSVIVINIDIFISEVIAIFRATGIIYCFLVIYNLIPVLKRFISKQKVSKLDNLFSTIILIPNK